MARIRSLTLDELAARGIDTSPFLADFAELPGSIATLGYRPDILQATLGLWTAVMGAGRVPADLKYMAGYLASKAAGCQYCSAHTASNAANSGASVEKIGAIWDYERSALFSASERAALSFAVLAGQSPSGVTDQTMEQLAEHFDEEQIVELLSVVALYGFFNRWNDSLATTLEATPRQFSEANLAGQGWSIGNHSA
ncbi:carboxymuconolactone decarboxylase family protein [Blastomonas sp.]|uniref:carboxymuconolactone decarboxylase family protein n=1 Tax=Blastomonas sp. TaxID=1909299 RepID=UPI00391BD5A5